MHNSKAKRAQFGTLAKNFHPVLENLHKNLKKRYPDLSTIRELASKNPDMVAKDMELLLKGGVMHHLYSSGAGHHQILEKAKSREDGKPIETPFYADPKAREELEKRYGVKLIPKTDGKQV